MFFFKKRRHLKLGDDIVSDSKTKKPYKTLCHYSLLKKQKSTLYILNIIFLFNDLSQYQGKRWFYNDVEMFLHQKHQKTASKENNSSGNW